MAAEARAAWEEVEECLRHYLALCGVQHQLVVSEAAEGLASVLAEKDRQMDASQRALSRARAPMPAEVADLVASIEAQEEATLRVVERQLGEVRGDLARLASERRLTRAYGPAAATTSHYLDARD